MLATGMLVSYGYFSEVWMAWYSHGTYEWGTTLERMFGPYGWSYWALITCNFIIPQLLWFRWIRYNDLALFLISIVVLIGMWFERYVIVITLTRVELPATWGRYAPTYMDWLLFIGTMGVFTFLFLMFVRFLPMCSITEVRESLPKVGGGRDGHSLSENAP
jgi:molybdopterin-containing oxidoreductase family membrane subunit